MSRTVYLCSCTGRSAFCVVLLLALTLLLLVSPGARGASVPPRPHVEASLKWLYPCNGATVEASSAESETTGSVEEVEVPVTVSIAAVMRHFENIIRKTVHLDAFVQDLQDKYVLHHLHDRAVLDSFTVRESSGGMVGMLVSSARVEQVSASGSISDHVLLAYERLARLARYIERARIDETLSCHQFSPVRHGFIAEFNDLEHHVHGGHYHILCDLHNVMNEYGVALNDSVTEEVRAIVVPGDGCNIVHFRNWIVLTAMRQVVGEVRGRLQRIVAEHREAGV